MKFAKLMALGLLISLSACDKAKTPKADEAKESKEDDKKGEEAKGEETKAG